ncbi:hypothetical protein COY27_02680 [Candidatus Woesearchaeota archaeon CG_4_10_14_0_2_um_filter_33_13]|nr:MAG: hypothetical protein COY27_02680 [Candidatus Woesearchaeota archaeon CG_4_10_14_0_2_um_filter_33_13]
MKQFSNLNRDDIKKTYSFQCKIEEIRQTSGPTIFTLYDGTKTIKSTGFIKPGERAFPELERGQNVSIKGQVFERDGFFEIEIKEATPLNSDLEKEFIENLEKLANQQAEPFDIPFIVDSKVLNDLRPMMLNVAKEIRKAIFSNRKIILKHHADCDGYSAGIALERAILPLIQEQHGVDSAEWFYYKRGPSKAPFYEYADVVKDLSFSIDDMNRFGQKAPLIILADNGSTEQDLLAIKKLKIYGAKVVVIDHHYPGEVVNYRVAVDEFLDAHVNPYLMGHDSTMCAGILGTEIARMINNNVHQIKHIPALAATADRSKGEAIDKYKEIAFKIGLDQEYLSKLAECIDFESYYVKFMESRGLVNDLFGADVDKQRQMVELLYKDIEKRYEKSLLAAKHYMKVEDGGKYLLVSLVADKVTSRGEYPAIGKLIGMTHDFVSNQNPSRGVISMGLGPDFITLRMSDSVNFSVSELINELTKKIPHGSIEGGGHKHAGSIKFLEGAHDEVHKLLFEKLRGF